jgi:SAM-dependent methyltransferase
VVLNVAGLAHRVRIATALVRSPGSLLGQWLICPICNYRGPFLTVKPPIGGRRLHARCLRCGSLERHRLQYLVLEEVLRGRDCSQMEAIHFAPEPFFRDLFRRRFRSYLTADIDGRGVDRQADIRALPFADRSFDFIFGSHVLEHIDDDRKALAELARVLRPEGIAILPVPIVARHTVEYPHPVQTEYGHVRAPGLDYYERYRPFFKRIVVRTSADFDDVHQTWSCEDRTLYPTKDLPYRPPMPGERHIDAVPVCWAG